MSKTLSARIASALLITHGLIEIASLVLSISVPDVLVSFGGLTGELLEENAQAIAMLGAFWGISRLVAAGGCWSIKKWALVLGVLLSLVTMVAAVTIVPAGTADTFFSILVLTLLLYAWFGGEQITV